jgi:predicted peptidase
MDPTQLKPTEVIVDFDCINRPLQAALEAQVVAPTPAFNFSAASAPISVNAKVFTPEYVARVFSYAFQHLGGASWQLGSAASEIKVYDPVATGAGIRGVLNGLGVATEAVQEYPSTASVVVIDAKAIADSVLVTRIKGTLRQGWKVLVPIDVLPAISDMVEIQAAGHQKLLNGVLVPGLEFQAGDAFVAAGTADIPVLLRAPYSQGTLLVLAVSSTDLLELPQTIVTRVRTALGLEFDAPAKVACVGSECSDNGWFAVFNAAHSEASITLTTEVFESFSGVKSKAFTIAAHGLLLLHDGPVATYKLINQLFPWGHDTTHIIIDFGEGSVVTQAEIDALSIYSTNVVNALDASVFVFAGTHPLALWSVATTNDYYLNDYGWVPFPEAAEEGRYIWLELAHGRWTVDTSDFYSDVPGASTIFWREEHNMKFVIDYDYRLKLAGSKMRFVKEVEINPLIENFTVDTYTPSAPHDATDYLDYAYFVPEIDQDVPLVVWLHGFSEGRQPGQPRAWSALRGFRQAGEWVSPEVQRNFHPAVLIPQSPNAGWFVNGQNAVLGYNNALPNVNDVITLLVTQYPQIDTSRIYVLGNSMGGYGAWTALHEYPTLFAAMVSCPGGFASDGYPDNVATFFTPEDIAAIATVPIWIFNTDGDFTLNTANYEVLKAANANVRWTHYATPEDAGTPGQAHAVWAPVLDNVPETDDQ